MFGTLGYLRKFAESHFDTLVRLLRELVCTTRIKYQYMLCLFFASLFCYFASVVSVCVYVLILIFASLGTGRDGESLQLYLTLLSDNDLAVRGTRDIHSVACVFIVFVFFLICL